MINLQETEITENTFKNLGEMVAWDVINTKINPILKRKVDLRQTNQGKDLYINIGDSATAQEINEAYNS